MKWNGRTRCALLCLVFIALFSLFSFRLVYLQLLKHDDTPRSQRRVTVTSKRFMPNVETF